MDFLSERELQCLAMYFYDGLRQREIAKSLGIKQRTVSHYLDRGRAKLAEHGMTPQRLQREERPKTILMDPRQMDNLDPESVVAAF